MKKQIIHVRADEHTVNYLNELAKKYNVSKSDVILNALVLLNEELKNRDTNSLITAVIKRLAEIEKLSPAGENGRYRLF